MHKHHLGMKQHVWYQAAHARSAVWRRLGPRLASELCVSERPSGSALQVRVFALLRRWYGMLCVSTPQRPVSWPWAWSTPFTLCKSLPDGFDRFRMHAEAGVSTLPLLHIHPMTLVVCSMFSQMHLPMAAQPADFALPPLLQCHHTAFRVCLVSGTCCLPAACALTQT